jgi:hypothetical protein
MKSLKFSTSQHLSPGATSLALGIAYTDGLLNEEQISRAIELAISSFISSISHSIVGNVEEANRQGRVANETTSQRDSLDEILEQILCEGINLSTV